VEQPAGAQTAHDRASPGEEGYAILVALVLPSLTRFVPRLGALFLVGMTLDGFAIIAMGLFTGMGPVALGPMVATLSVDRGLTGVSDRFADLAQNSASSTAMRGRIAAAYALAAILGDIFAEMGSTAVSEAYGPAGMLVRLGVGQCVLLVVLAVVGGKQLWMYGLRARQTA
jgi:hypothetical protein